jgi:heavy metal sensor kinase
MRSIRLSLTLYFLGLLAAALGTACLLVYRIAGQTLEVKRAAAEKRIEAQYQERCRAEETHLNNELLSQAQTLARLTQFQFDFSRVRFSELPALGVLSTALAPGGYLLVPTWAGQGVRGGPRDAPYAFEMHRRFVPTEIKLNTSDLLREVDGQVAEYFQIDGRTSTYRSESLAGRSFTPPREIGTFALDQLVHWDADDARLDDNTLVRRVTFKVAVARWGPMDAGVRRRPPGVEPERPPRAERPWPTILVQCANDLHKRDAALGGFTHQRDAELADLEADTRDSLARVRGRLLWLGTATFAATVLGCFFLVRLGLMPLRRLSEAVSRVSPRDFHLPVDEGRLPGELRPIAERLAETLGQLARAFAREKQATADMSHELRTPLAALLATTELALRKPRGAEDYREFLAECRRSAKQMNEVVERLLALARLDAGVDRLRVQAVDAAMLAEQAAAVVRPLAAARGLRLDVHLPDDPGAARLAADPDKVREVLTNLLHNAIQYNQPGGSIDLAVRRDNGALVLEVCDTGIGIAAAAREHIFERFWRADPSRGQDGLHAGLGLAIVKEYVDLMGGAITVDSAEGKGSTFRIRLPVRGAVA